MRIVAEPWERLHVVVEGQRVHVVGEPTYESNPHSGYRDPDPTPLFRGRLVVRMGSLSSAKRDAVLDLVRWTVLATMATALAMRAPL